MNQITELIQTVLGDLQFQVSFLLDNKFSDHEINHITVVDESYKKFRSSSHDVKLFDIELPNKIYNGDELLSVKAKILQFKKINDHIEKIKISFKLLNDLEAIPESGESLESIIFENINYKLSIGTYDSEVMLSQAIRNQSMPKRFVSFLKSEKDNFADKTFLSYLSNGFEINFPELENGEEIKIHFIIAEDLNKGENDISTYLAVDIIGPKLKEFLENN